jgi:GT2 family glycosyltransferase
LQEKEATHTPPCLERILAGMVVAEVERQLSGPKRVLVVVLTWNLLELTKQCIDSVRSWHNYELFVIDNDSTDGTQAWLEEQGIEFVSKRCNVAEAWTAGMKQAYDGGCDYALICNNDIILSPTYIDVVVETAERRHALAVTGRVFNRDESTIDKFQTLTQEVEVNVQAMNSGDYSAILISRVCMERVGAFDVQFGPRYQEDEDHALRMRLIEEPLLKTYHTTFYHLSGATMLSSTERLPAAGEEWRANVERFKAKWHVDPYAERQVCSSTAEMKRRNPDWEDKIKIPL